MEINKTTTANGDPKLELEGRFDAFETAKFQHVIDPLIEGTGNKVTVDMSQVIFIDSSGLADMVRAMKRSREGGGELYIHNPSDPVRVILELTRLDAAFEFSED